MIMCVICVCQEWYTHAVTCACGGWRTTLWSWFSPPTFTWVLGIELRRSDFSSKHFHLLNHLLSPLLWSLLLLFITLDGKPSTIHGFSNLGAEKWKSQKGGLFFFGCQTQHELCLEADVGRHGGCLLGRERLQKLRIPPWHLPSIAAFCSRRLQTLR